MILRKSRRELERMAAAGSIVARTLALLRERARPGVTTGELDRAAEEFIRGAGRRADVQGLPRLPGLDLRLARTTWSCTASRAPTRCARATCSRSTSASRCAAGSPTPATRSGSARASRPRTCGACSTACRASLFAAVEQCVDGHHLSDIGHAVQTRVEADGFGVIRSLVGHGVGRRMHEDPQIPNYGPPGRGHVLRPGMTLAIEPMITASGETDVQLDEDDGWSIYSADHSLTAHYEHTVAVTDDGPLILTRHEGWSPVDDEVAPTRDDPDVAAPRSATMQLRALPLHARSGRRRRKRFIRCIERES